MNVQMMMKEGSEDERDDFVAHWNISRRRRNTGQVEALSEVMPSNDGKYGVVGLWVVLVVVALVVMVLLVMVLVLIVVVLVMVVLVWVVVTFVVENATPEKIVVWSRSLLPEGWCDDVVG